MYVCVCLGVTDREVEAAIDEGAATRLEVTQRCSAGGDCGACHQAIEAMIEDRAACAADATDAPITLSLRRTRAA